MRASILLLALFACATSERRAPAPLPAPPPRREPEVVAPEEKPAPRTTTSGIAWNPARTMTVHVLDIGQGMAVLLELPCGAVLVDTGGERNSAFDGDVRLGEELDAFFARRTELERTLDLLVLTHPHLDHVRGVPRVLRDYTVRNVVTNGQRGDELVEPSLRPLVEAIERGDVRHRAARTEELPAAGLHDDVVDPIVCAEVDPRITVLAGSHGSDPGFGDDDYGPHFADENNHSVVLRVDFGAASVLLTGDLETPAIEHLLARHGDDRSLDVDLLIVGHHGSANGITPSLLDAVSPRMAVIPTGHPERRGSFTAYAHGHPRRRVVELLQDAIVTPRVGVDVLVASGQRRFSSLHMDRAVYATGWDGTVTVKLSADGPLEALGERRQ